MNRRRYQVVLAAVLITLAAGIGRAGAVAPARLTARAAILIDNRSGEVLFERNPDLQLPPASTTKILTAYLALRSGALEREVRVSSYASQMQPSKIGLKPGWSMNVEDLVYAVLLNSANDASVVLAEGLAGSVPAFAQQMTATAHQLGATRSNFVNPNGLPAEYHYSTARDLTTIMRHAMRLPLFQQVLSTQTTAIRPAAGSTRTIALRSHNRLLARRDIQVIGKTGWTREAKHCFVGAATDGDREIVFAVMGATRMWPDLNRLIDFGLKRGAASSGAAAAIDWGEASDAAEDGAAASATRYRLQLASFRDRAAATRLQHQVVRHGYRPVVEHVSAGRRKSTYRVTVRGFTSRASAQKAARALRKLCRIEPRIIAEGA